MFVLHSFGLGVLQLLGAPSFLTLYLLSGLTGSLFSITHAYIFRPRPNPYFPIFQQAPSPGSLGASGAIAGPMVFFTLLYPRAQMLLFMVIPVPAWAAIGGFFVWDVWRSLGGRSGVTDSAGHVGGAVAGIGYWWWKYGRGKRIGRWRL